MAKTERTPIFAMGTYASISPAVESGELAYPSYVFCRDTNTLVFINRDRQICNVKGYNQEAIITVINLPTQGIRSDAIYICNGVGYLYIDGEFVPVLRDISGSTSSDSYNDIMDVPIINKYGTSIRPIILSELADGVYSIFGQYQIGDGGTIYIPSKNVLFLVDTDDDGQHITKLGAAEIIEYTVALDSGSVSAARYATEFWIEEHGYAEKAYVDEAINDLYQKIIAELSITKLSQLENDVGFISEADIEVIDEEQINALF